MVFISKWGRIQPETQICLQEYSSCLRTACAPCATLNHSVGQNHAICTFQLCRIACDLCHSFPLLCAAPPSIPSHPAVVFAPARALLASCPAPPASSCRAAPPPDPPATAPTWTLTPWSADSSLLDCQVNVKNVIGHCHCDIVTRYWNY